MKSSCIKEQWQRPLPVERIIKITKGFLMIKKKNQSDKMVPLLVSFLIFCCCQFILSNGKKWDIRILKGIKSHVLTSLW